MLRAILYVLRWVCSLASVVFIAKGGMRITNNSNLTTISSSCRRSRENARGPPDPFKSGEALDLLDYSELAF